MSTPINIIFQGKELQLESWNELSSIIDGLGKTGYNELWIEGKDGSTMCVMTNPTNAFFVYMAYKGDSGFRSNNPRGDENVTQEFILSNGQADYYPETYLTDKSFIREAVKQFYDSGKMPDCIQWVE